MGFKEPSSIEIFFTIVVGYAISSFFWNYVKNLNLNGNERILEYGSGSGALSKHMAPILMEGGGHLTCVDISHKWMNIIQKRISRYPNVDFKLGKIDEVDIPDNSHDIVVIHYVLHDIESDSREGIIRALAAKLRSSGKIYIREPIADNHGMPTCEIIELMENTGLKQIDLKINKLKVIGNITEAIFEK